MSISMDESKQDRGQLEVPKGPASDHNAATWQEALLTNSFDEQIKLVEKSVATLKNDNAKEKRKNKKTERKKSGDSAPQETENSQKQYSEHVFTNRSRIYRFGSKEQVPANPATAHLDSDQMRSMTKPPTRADQIMEPPKDESDARASMLMSWYMAGYQTGYYEAMRRYKSDLD